MLKAIIAGASALWAVLGLLSFAGGITHIIVTIQAKAWLFLLAGLVVPPIGVVHGIACWFGANWL